MTLIELIWTITPALILIAIAFPSFRLLYLLDEVTSPTVTIKVTGLIGLKFIINSLKTFFIKRIYKINTFLYLQSNANIERSHKIKKLIVKNLSKNRHSVLNLYHNNLLLSHSSNAIFIRNPMIIRVPNRISDRFLPLSSSNIITFKNFHTRCRAINRIGPHNIDVISILVGLLLGDGYLNNRSGEGARMAIKQSITHKEYLFSLYEFFYNRGYCTSLLPRLYTRSIKGKDKNYYGFEFNTFTFRSLVWLHTLFYKKGKKVIPSNISELLTPLALAIWISDDGGWVGSGVRIAANSFTLEEIQLLSEVLKTKFDLDCTIQNISIENKYAIYIKKISILKLRNLISPYLHETMYYKLGL